MRHDTHWSGAGIGRAAQTVREELARLGWLDRLGAEEVLEPIVRRYELAGDLTMVCGIRAKSALARELSVQNETFAVARPGGGGICAPEQKDAMVALAGTSFSDYGLRQVLPLALKRRVDSVCVRPGSRPFESILELLHRIERGEIHPRLVVWESHERSLAVETWDEALSALGPN